MTKEEDTTSFDKTQMVCYTISVICSTISIILSLIYIYLKYNGYRETIKKTTTTTTITEKQIIPVEVYDSILINPSPVKHDYKLGIYSKKEGIREFPYMKHFDDIDIIVPNLTKKLKKNKNDKGLSFTELEFLKDGHFIGNYKSNNMNNLPIKFFESIKIIAFTEQKISLNITMNEPRFIILFPISTDIQISLLNEDTEKEEEVSLNRPILIRTEKTIIISKNDNIPKQFLMFKINKLFS
jgi:hypothetical protein